MDVPKWMRRARRITTGLALALTMGALLAPPAMAADNWSGIWNTAHKFGTPKLKLDLVRQSGADRVEGIYKDNGRIIGDIWGELSEHRTVWSGRFKDREGDGSKGKFAITLQGDQVSFRGWFKTCGRVLCSERYRWTGEHA